MSYDFWANYTLNSLGSSLYLYICICVVVFVYLYLCICICVFVFVYMYLCICICVFVFVYLYLCICICVFVMRFERILHWKALGCLSGIDFLHSPLYNQSLLGVIINRGLNNWKQCEKTKENLLKWLSLVFSPSTERETLHWDTYQSMFWKTLKRNPTESTMFCICPVFSRMFQRLVWIQV